MLSGASDDSEEEGSEEGEGSEDDEEEDSDEGEDVDLESDSDELADEDVDSLGPEALGSAIEEEVPRSDRPGTATGELPYTFPCPSTHAEFVKLLRSSGIPESETATVVKRIRVLYHPGLGESNKEKLQVRLGVIVGRS